MTMVKKLNYVIDINKKCQWANNATLWYTFCNWLGI